MKTNDSCNLLKALQLRISTEFNMLKKSLVLLVFCSPLFLHQLNQWMIEHNKIKTYLKVDVKRGAALRTQANDTEKIVGRLPEGELIDIDALGKRWAYTNIKGEPFVIPLKHLRFIIKEAFWGLELDKQRYHQLTDGLFLTQQIMFIPLLLLFFYWSNFSKTKEEQASKPNMNQGTDPVHIKPTLKQVTPSPTEREIAQEKRQAIRNICKQNMAIYQRGSHSSLARRQRCKKLCVSRK
jgi:hypothetical protein